MAVGGRGGGEAVAKVAHRSARDKKVEGFIRRLMEMMAVTVKARGGDYGGVDDNDDNGAIAMVINLDLCTAGV